MSEIAIRVENLSKRYQIGVAQQRHDTLRDALADLKTRLGDFARRAPHSALRTPQSGEFWALRDVSFEVKRGEVVGIIGRNGAGKSTLLKILSRITEPTSGQAQIHGRVGSLLEVGTGFHPELTGRENIYLNGAILGMRRFEIERKFDEIVAFAEIEKFLDTPVKRYSSGMYVRLAFAVAAHLEPEILLVDEVLAVGDAAFQKKCLGKMGDVAREGRTVLFVSHNMAAILSLCNRVMIIQSGSKHFDGLCEQGITKYLRVNEIESTSAIIPLEYLPRSLHQTNILTNLHLTDSARQPRTKFNIGEPIHLQIELSTPYYLDNPNVGIGINDYLGLRITTVTTHLQGIQLPRFKGRSTVECCINGLNLAPGMYGLKLAIGNGTEDIDSIELQNAFTIVESDYWGGGKMPNSTQGSILTNAKWAVIQ